MNARTARKRRSVALYIALALLICALGTALQIGLSTKQSYDRERSRAATALEGVTSAQAADVDSTLTGVPPLLQGLARNPDIANFDPARCRRAFASLEGGINGARVTALDPSGRQVCSTGDPARSARRQPLGPWFAQARSATQPVWVPPGPDALGGGAVILAANRIVGRQGVGVLLFVLYDQDWVSVPAGQPSDTAVFVLDAQRRTVFATTANAAVRVGTTIGDGRYAHLVAGHGVTTVREANGRWLYAVSTVPTLGLQVVGGRLESRAFGPAAAVFHQSLVVGAASLALLVLLGIVFYRMLARPLRGLAHVVGASGDDDEVRVDPTGPREVVSLAERFNELLDERRAREADLRWRATHDVLTGLPNRYAITELLDGMMQGPTRAPGALLFLDLDRFKLVNDSHGHIVGDEVLSAVARRLSDVLPEGHVLCRFGGDEFVVLSPATSLPGAERLARTLIAAVCQPITVQHQDLHIGACVGIAAATPGTSTHDIIRDADTAMYRAKANGTGSTAVFDDVMHDWAVSRLGLENDLRGALERGELAVHYQPIVDLRTGQVAAAEALLRWTHPRRGVVAPQDFIPVAEQSGLILPIGRWVLETAARQAVAWTRDAGRPVRVAVNISAVQIAAGDLAAEVHDVLAAIDAPPSLLELEVTEGSLLEDVDVADASLTALRSLGVTIALDDFGTGYSSLSHLQRLPLDVIKVDRSFVTGVDADVRSSRIVQAVVSLANALNLTVIAEGVENQRELACLQQLGCHDAQGFLLSMPGPAEAITALVLGGAQLPRPTVRQPSASVPRSLPQPASAVEARRA